MSKGSHQIEIRARISPELRRALLQLRIIASVQRIGDLLLLNRAKRARGKRAQEALSGVLSADRGRGDTSLGQNLDKRA